MLNILGQKLKEMGLCDRKCLHLNHVFFNLQLSWPFILCVFEIKTKAKMETYMIIQMDITKQ